MLFRFRYGHVRVQVEEGHDRTLDKMLRIPDPRANDDLATHMRLWDGLIHFYDRETKTFPAGLLGRLLRRLEKRGHTYEVTYDEELPVVPPIHPGYLVGMDLRDYQVESANECLEKRRGLLQLATGAGKSLVLSAVAGAVARATGKQFIVIVPNKYLLHQTGDDVQKYLGPDIKVGKVGDGIKDTNCDIIVGTYQTLMQGAGHKPDRQMHAAIKNCIGILTDEAQHMAATGITTIYEAAENAVFRLGCSGSLDKHDRVLGKRADDRAREHRWRLEALTGPILYEVTNAYLIDQGLNAAPTIKIVRDRSAYGPTVVTPPPNPMMRNAAMLAYKSVFTRAVIQDKTYLKTVCRLAAASLAQGKAPFVFSHSVEHLKALYATAKAMRVPCELVTGKDTTRRRKEVIQRFVDEQNFVAFSSPIFDEGMSISCIRTVILAGTRKSPIEILQRIGRGLRKKKDDNTLTVIEFCNPHSTLLAKQYRSRLAVYKEQGFEIEHLDDVSRPDSLTL